MNFSNPFKKIVLIGAGNIATHFGLAFKNIGCTITQVYSRTEMSAVPLALLLDSEPIWDLNLMDQDADLYIIAVSDSAIEDVLSKIYLNGKTIVHTSGSVPMDILSKVSENYGVIYAPQTFVKGLPLSYDELCFCVEASNKEVEKNLNKFLKFTSKNITYADSKQRSTLHLAAVIVSNFSNCLYSIADEILSKENIPLKVLQPLINETAKKPEYGNPRLLQTGPAKRHDENIIQKHLEMLKNNSNYSELYRLFTKIIQEDNNEANSR